jgi:hypothetical protein
MCFLIIINHLLEHIIEKTVIGNNWQINNYTIITNVQSNLVELQLKKI